MSFSKLVRNLYTYPDSGGFPAPHDSLHHSQDLDNFHLPQSRMHNLHLHDWGIARGLEVSGAIGGTQLRIGPGVAVGRNGEIIALAPDGHASLIPEPSDPTDLVAVPVTLTLPTLDDQPRYLTIEYMEFLDTSGGAGAWVEVVPRIRLQPTSGTDAYTADSASIVLAIVRVDATGHLTSLQAVESGLPFRRRLIGEQAETLSIRRPALTGDKADELPAGKISGREEGGLKITVPNQADGVVFAQEDGSTFASLDLRADTVTAKDASNREVFQLDSGTAALRLGATGNAGDLIVRDEAGRDVIRLDGDQANLTIGATGNHGDLTVIDQDGQQALHFNSFTSALKLGRPGKDGDIIVLDSSGTESVMVNGSAGAIEARSLSPRAGALAVRATDLTLADSANATTASIAGSTGALSARSISTGTLSATGAVSAPTVTASSSISAATLNATGAISGATVNATTSVSAPTVSATTSVSAPTVTASSAISTGTLNATGAISGATVSATTSVSAPTVSATTSVSAPTVNATTSLSTPTVTATSAVNTNTLGATTVNATTVNATTLNASSSLSVPTLNASSVINVPKLIASTSISTPSLSVSSSLSAHTISGSSMSIGSLTAQTISLSGSVHSSQWQRYGAWNPGRNVWHTFYEQSTYLLYWDWRVVTMCEVGMLDGGSVNNFWWLLDNTSYIDSNNHRVVRWAINYRDDGTDWYPYSLNVFWLAYRIYA